MIFITHYGIYLSALLALFLAFKAELKERKALILIVFALPISVLLIKIIHIFYFEPRPFVANQFMPLIKQAADASFPSRHATIMAVIAFSYTYFKSKWSYLFLGLMILIGISRVYVGVHYWHDVIGGYATGAVSLAVVFFSASLLRART